ncbi:MAG TPA: ATP-binding protein [Ignavibacteria bacterium]
MKRKIISFLFFIFAVSVLNLNGQTRNIIDSLKQKLSTANGAERIDLLNALSNKILDVSVTKSLDYSFEAIKLSREIKDIESEILSLAYLAQIHLSSSSLDSGFEVIKTAIDLLPNVKNKYINGYVYMVKGRLELEVYHYENAFQDFYNSHLLFEEVKDYENSIKTLMLLGTLFSNLKDFEESNEYYKKALEEAENHSLTTFIPVMLNTIAFNLFYEGNYDKATESCNYALKKGIEFNNIDEQITSYTYLGDYYLDIKKNYDSTLAYYNKALELAKKIENKIAAAMLLTKSAHTFMLKNDMQTALKLDKEALVLRIAVGKTPFIGSSYTNVGSDFLRMGEYDSSYTYLQKGLQIAVETSRYNFQEYAYRILSNLFLKKNDFKKAYEYYLSSSSARDSVLSRDKGNEVSKFKFKYELAKMDSDLKELEISQQNFKLVFFALLAIILTVASIITTIYYLKNKRANKNLLKLSEEQEGIIKQRTMELEKELSKQKQIQEEINRALDKEKQLNELKSRFVSMVSHEFRTPLTSINLNIEMLKRIIQKNDSTSIGKTIKHTENIKNEIKRVTSLMEDILLRGKLEAGRMDFNPEMVNLKEITEEIIENYRNKSKNIKIELSISGAARDVNIDTNMMYLILSNLISNAIKYSGSGEIVKVDLIFGKKEVIISIADYGIGIPEDEQENLFMVFYRARNSKDIKGYGLGLAITKQFIEMHNGKIEFESRENEGSKFTVTIPES